MQAFDKTTCWYMPDGIVAAMLKNYDVYLPLMDTTPHISALKRIIEKLPAESKVIDIGCGTAQISLLFKQHTYMGADLDFIIDRVAKIKHPENHYIHFNAETDPFEWLNNADTLLLNAFIDIMQYPLAMLEKILSVGVKNVILHRQEFTIAGKTHVIKNSSYCGETYHSIININEFFELMKKHGYWVNASHSCGFGNWENGGDSMLLQKTN